MIFITTLAGIPRASAVHTNVLRAAWVVSTSHFLEAEQADITAGQHGILAAHGAHFDLIVRIIALHFPHANLAVLLAGSNVVQVATGAFFKNHGDSSYIDPDRPVHHLVWVSLAGFWHIA